MTHDGYCVACLSPGCLCPMHEAATVLLAACKATLEAYDTGRCFMHSEDVKVLRAAVAQGEGRS